MWSDLPLWPDQASTSAAQVDALYLFLIGLTIFLTALICGLVTFFAVRYRRRGPGDPVPEAIEGNTRLEILWTVIPFCIVMGLFVWSAALYVHLSRPPDGAMQVNVVGKRWMWKLQHLNGRREINELHVPAGSAVELTLTSEDVIHSFYVPAFRVKADVVPGRYTSMWFRATRPGTYHLFCAEYCGTKHSGMGGSVIVMEPAAFQAWLGGDTGESLVEAGTRLFGELGCATCHVDAAADSPSRGPKLAGLWGSEVTLHGGGTVTADEAYVRESILDPTAKITEGYPGVMPTFRGLMNEEQMLQLIAYVKSRGVAESAPPARKEAAQ